MLQDVNEGRHSARISQGVQHVAEPQTACTQAYADYEDVMKLSEDLLSSMVLELKGSYKMQYHAVSPSRGAEAAHELCTSSNDALQLTVC